MEVQLLSKRGLPDDAIISIRSGSVRRQGNASTDKPFRFPQSAGETDCVVKVDIMQNIGSGYLVMRPNQTDGKAYEVVLGGNSDMACSLSVKPADGTAGPSAAETQEDAQAAAKTKQDAKAYLETTGLLTFVQGVLQVVAKQQPQDPFAAMAKYFLSASDEAAAPGPGSPKVAPATPKNSFCMPEVVPEAPAPASASPKAEAQADEAAAKAAPEAPAPAPESPKAEAAADEAAAKAEPAEGEAAPESEAKAAPAPEADAKAEEAADKEEPDQVDDKKSDTLEEFTSTVKGATLGDATATEQDDTAAKEAEQPQENQAAPDAAEEAKEAAAAPEETPNDGAGAAAEGEGQAAQPDTAEAAADDKKEEAAAETNGGAE